MSDVTASIDLYESDIIRIEQALKPINSQVGTQRNMDGFRREVQERFAEQGFKVDVKCWETTSAGVYAFDIDIVDRMEVKEEGFDHERQHYEVVNDVLDIDPSNKGEVMRAPNNKAPGRGLPKTKQTDSGLIVPDKD